MSGFDEDPFASDTPELDSTVLEMTLTTVMSLAHPDGMFARLSPFIDELYRFRFECDPSGWGVASIESESAIVFAYGRAYARIRDAKAQIMMSLQWAEPSLGVLMERDVANAALGIISNETVESLQKWTKLVMEERDLSPDEAETLVTDVAEVAFGGHGAIALPVASFADHLVTSAGKWYVEPTISFAEALGVSLAPPASLKREELSWLRKNS